MLCTHVRISVALVRKVAESQAKREYVEFKPFIGVIFMNRTGRATLSILAGLNTPGPTHRSRNYTRLKLKIEVCSVRKEAAVKEFLVQTQWSHNQKEFVTLCLWILNAVLLL